LHCLFFALHLLATPLASSNFPDNEFHIYSIVAPCRGVTNVTVYEGIIIDVKMCGK
jgi:hypothetical protein